MKFPTTTPSSLDKIRAIIRDPKNKTFLISTHVNPDPDALCSQLAVAMLLKKFGKKPVLLNHDEVPGRFHFLPASDSVRSIKSVREPVYYDVAFIVDCGDLARIGDVIKFLKDDNPVVNIDHHITNDGFGQAHWIDPSASSTCELLFDLIEKLGVELSHEMAQLLYVGIMGDTGGFRYDNTTPKTHRIAATLQEFRISPSDYYRKIYESIPVGDLRQFIKIMNRLEFSASGRIVSLTISERSFASFSEDFDLKESVFRFLRSIKDVDVALIFTKVARNKTRVNFRSTDTVDVAAVAKMFNGGGHRNASGCTVDAPAETVKPEVLKAVERRLS